jgi:hypothetical protein
VYGLDPNDVTVHDGQQSWTDFQNLTVWQRRYALLDREGVVTGHFDGPTQRACIGQQKLHNLPVTAVLDEATWYTVWREPPGPPEPPKMTVQEVVAALEKAAVKAPESHADATEPETPVEPKGKAPAKPMAVKDPSPKPRLGERVSKSNANKILWRHRDEGEAPAWMNLPPDDQLDTAMVKLGLTPNADLEEFKSRVRGVQRLSALPETGILDSATAWLIEERSRPLR